MAFHLTPPLAVRSGRWQAHAALGPVVRRAPRALAGAVALALCLSGTAGAATTTTTYAGTDEKIANPERGLYHHDGDCDKTPFTPGKLAAWRSERISLALCIFYLDKTPDISAQVGVFNARAKALRDAGFKMILRFAYTQNESGDDVAPERVHQHLDQLAPHLRSNADVIAMVQSGFVGAWGEGYYTQHFGSPGNEDWVARKAVVDRLLAILPTNRTVHVRTVAMKRAMYGTAVATPGDVSAARPVARVGYHNDCFLGINNDQGTWQNGLERDHLLRDELVPLGGETCGQIEGTRASCINATAELAQFGFGYLNEDKDTVDAWKADGCFDDVHRGLGYRFALASVTSPTSVARGTKLRFRMTVRNDGFSGVINPRAVLLVLRHRVTKKVHRFQIGNARTWVPGAPATLDRLVAIPATMPTGTYDLLLSLPDGTQALRDRPEYAVQLANPGLWEPGTGLNHLRRAVAVQ